MSTEIANSKNLLVEAHDEDGKFFIAFEHPITGIVSIENTPDNSPSITIHSFKDRDEFIESITWNDWIVSGVKDHYIKFRV